MQKNWLKLLTVLANGFAQNLFLSLQQTLWNCKEKVFHAKYFAKPFMGTAVLNFLTQTVINIYQGYYLLFYKTNNWITVCQQVLSDLLNTLQ